MIENVIFLGRKKIKESLLFLYILIKYKRSFDKLSKQGRGYYGKN